MIEITRHMDGRTAVLGATTTPVPKTWLRFSTMLDVVPVDVVYWPDAVTDLYHVLVNGLDVSPLLDLWAVQTIEQRIEADIARRAKEANDSALEDKAHDILQERGDV